MEAEDTWLVAGQNGRNGGGRQCRGIACMAPAPAIEFGKVSAARIFRDESACMHK